MIMKIQFMSDLHMELWDNSRYIKANEFEAKGDVLVLAGDTFYLRDIIAPQKRFWNWASKNFRQVLLVPGTLKAQHTCTLYGLVEVVKIILVKYHPHTVKLHVVLALQILLNLQRLFYQPHSCLSFSLNGHLSHGRDIAIHQRLEILGLRLRPFAHNQKTHVLVTHILLALLGRFRFLAFPLQPGNLRSR